MSDYISTRVTSTNELMHHGVKGMKWGKRKIQKWATSKNQPSSARSSVLAGLYAATGNKRIGKALDKSNDRDAKNWKQAKNEYKQTQDKPTSKMSTKKKVAVATAAVVGTALATYGAYKVSKAIKNKAYIKSRDRGLDAVKKVMSDKRKRELSVIDLMIDDGKTRYANMALDNIDRTAKRLTDDVYSTAHNNSKTLRSAIRTLRGRRQFSKAELEALGIKTF